MLSLVEARIVAAVCDRRNRPECPPCSALIERRYSFLNGACENDGAVGKVERLADSSWHWRRLPNGIRRYGRLEIGATMPERVPQSRAVPNCAPPEAVHFNAKWKA